jgi:hypothetical protein
MCTFFGIRLYTLKMYGENKIKWLETLLVTFSEKSAMQA